MCLFNSEHRLGDWNESLQERASTKLKCFLILNLKEVPMSQELPWNYSVTIVPKLQLSVLRVNYGMAKTDQLTYYVKLGLGQAKVFEDWDEKGSGAR